MIKHKFKLMHEDYKDAIYYKWRCVHCDYWLGVGKAYFRATLTVPEFAGKIPWSAHATRAVRLIPPCVLPYDGGNHS